MGRVGELVSWELVAEQDRATAFQGKILFTSPLVTDGPAKQSISFEECWRRLRAYGPIAIIYGNPDAGSLVLSLFFFWVFAETHALIWLPICYE
jgi:hypothetical protein